MMIGIRNTDFGRSEENGITSSWERISRRRGPQLFFTDNWMEAKATAPLYEWKPNSLITFAIAVDSLLLIKHRQVEGKKVINERLREGGARDDK